MAAEAIYQYDTSIASKKHDKSIRGIGVQFRNVSFLRAMVLSTTSDTNVHLSLKQSFQGSGAWHEFEIFSKDNDIVTTHCHGLVATSDNEGQGKSQSPIFV